MKSLKQITLPFQNIFAVLIFGGIYYYFLVHPDATVNETYKNILLIVVGYMFGSSKNSTKKDETIQNLADRPPGGTVDTIQTKDISGTVNAENVIQETGKTT